MPPSPVKSPLVELIASQYAAVQRIKTGEFKKYYASLINSYNVYKAKTYK